MRPFFSTICLLITIIGTYLTIIRIKNRFFPQPLQTPSVQPRSIDFEI